MDRANGQDPIPEVAHLPEVGLEHVKALVVVGEELSKAVVAVVGALHGTSCRYPDDVLVHVPQEGLYVTAARGEHGLLEHPHVLLRHRLLRQPHGHEGLLLVGVELDAADEAAFERAECRVVHRGRDMAALSEGPCQHSTSRRSPSTTRYSSAPASNRSQLASHASKKRRTPACPT